MHTLSNHPYPPVLCPSRPAQRLWSLDWLREQCFSAPLLVNDRAPARRSDALQGPDGQQHTVCVSISAYIDYIQVQARCCLQLQRITKQQR